MATVIQTSTPEPTPATPATGMWVIEMSRPDLRGGQFFRIWTSESSDVPEKRGPAYCAEYLKLLVEQEQLPEFGKRREYRMRYVLND